MIPRTSSRQLVAEALASVETISVDDAKTMLNAPDVVFVDIRETGELKRDGTQTHARPIVEPETAPFRLLHGNF